MTTKYSFFKTRFKLTLFVALLLAFGYGVTVGHYQIFPFAYLQATKAFIAGSVNGNYAAASEDQATQKLASRIDIFSVYESPSEIVMVGDSITDYVDWSELFPNLSIANRGIGGDTTEGVLNRLETIFSTRARLAFLMIGINDLRRGHSVDETYANYKKIVEELLAQKIQPVIQSTIFTGENKKEFNPKVHELNMRLIELAERKGIKFIDLNSVLAKNGTLASEFTSDGIHLNAAGYRIWARHIKPYVLHTAVSAPADPNSRSSTH